MSPLTHSKQAASRDDFNVCSHARDAEKRVSVFGTMRLPFSLHLRRWVNGFWWSDFRSDHSRTAVVLGISRRELDSVPVDFTSKVL